MIFQLFWRPCIYFWIKYSGIFGLLSLYITGILLTSNWRSRVSRSLGLLFNIIVGISGKILKCAISWKRLIIARNRWKFWARVLGRCIYDTFHVWFFEFSSGSFGALCKISDVKIFKTQLLPQVASNFSQNLMESMVIRVKYRPSLNPAHALHGRVSYFKNCVCLCLCVCLCVR